MLLENWRKRYRVFKRSLPRNRVLASVIVLLENWRKRYRLFKYSVPRDRVRASVSVLSDGFNIEFGAQSFFVKIGRAPDPNIATFDFAVFGLAAMSMSNNIEITLDSPVSESAASQLTRMQNTFDTWTCPKIAPLRLQLSTVVPNPECPPRSAVGICLSGGVDSTAAAIEALDAHALTHGMLIAGADYPGRDAPGFIELHRKVAQQAEILGIDLLVTETNIRTCGFQWEMLHSLNLAMCLHANSDLLTTGAIGADLTDIQDLTMHPWGTSHAMSDLFPTANMGILSLNRTRGRTEKLREICNKTPELVEKLSVCWVDTSTGNNCGKCIKCQRTKLNFLAAIGEVPDIFIENPSVVDFVQKLSVPKRSSEIKTELVQMSNIYQNLDEGELKSVLGVHLAKIKKAYVLRMPMP